MITLKIEDAWKVENNLQICHFNDDKMKTGEQPHFEVNPKAIFPDRDIAHETN